MNRDFITHIHSMYQALLYLVGASLALAGYIHWHEAARKNFEGEAPVVRLSGSPDKPIAGFLEAKRECPGKQRLPS